MKKILFFVCIVFSGCAKTNEDVAKELIVAKLKTQLPDFKSYESISFSSMGSSFLSFEETERYINNARAIKTFKDSAFVLQQISQGKGNSSVDSGLFVSQRIQQLQESARINDSLIRIEKRAYTPEKLSKITHSFKARDTTGIENIYKREYYFDKDFKKIIKENILSN